MNEHQNNMHPKLQSAALSGDVNTLHQLLHENPFILSDYVLISSPQNPLTTAIKANQLLFVREILKLIKPELAAELDHDGFRPLDVASAYGNVEIVGEILAAARRPDIVRLGGGRDGRTAIHYAAANGRAETIDRLMAACSDSARDVTSLGETALHLAVKNFRFGAVRSMLQWLGKVDGLAEVVNWADSEGNTVLHHAVFREQLESVQLLLDWNKNNTRQNILELNAPNNKGLTPMDIADILIIESSNNDIHPIEETLRRSGGFTFSEFQVLSETPNSIIKKTTNTHCTREKPKSWIDIVKHFQFQWQRDSPGEARKALLVVVALIATVTFEAGINPPSYLFEASGTRNVTVSGGTNPDSNTTEISSSTDSSSMSSIIVFLFVNSIALSTAVSIIDYLTVGLPFQRELRVSICTMIFAYGWSLGNTRPTGMLKNILLVVAISMPLFLRLLPYAITKIRSRNKRNNSS